MEDLEINRTVDGSNSLISISDGLERHFKEMPKDDLEREWDEISQWNEIGPDAQEYVDYYKKESLVDGSNHYNDKKELLLKEIRERIPYDVKILHLGWNYEWDDELYTVERVVDIDDKWIYTKVIDTHNGEEYRDDKWHIDTFDDKLFLRSMTSMTEEERNEYMSIKTQDGKDKWLIKKMFAYRTIDGKDMFELGLAVEAPEMTYN